MMAGHLLDYHNRHEGATIIVWGFGSSLFPLLDWVTHFVNIGVNDACRYLAPDYLVLLDRFAKFSDERKAHILAACERCGAVFSPHLKDVSEHLSGGEADAVHFKVVQKEPWMKMVPDLTTMDHLHVAITSPYTGVCLAAYMGARRIGLVGVDFTDHELGVKEHMIEVNLDYRGLAEACKNAGIFLLNLSRDSLLETVPKGTIGDLLASPWPNPKQT